MKVKKRNGKLEEVQFDKITKRISRLLSKDDSLYKIIDPIKISQKICNRVYDQIPTSELDILASELCINMSHDNIAYSKLGAIIAIDNHHKNITHNLVQLCESCHHKVHNENLRIYGYHQTDQGIVLNYEYIDINQIHNPKKKFSKKDLQTILNYKDDIENKTLKKSNLLKKLELEHHIQISGSTLNKILRGEY